jgi:hypothetical protein
LVSRSFDGILAGHFQHSGYWPDGCLNDFYALDFSPFDGYFLAMIMEVRPSPFHSSDPNPNASSAFRGETDSNFNLNSVLSDSTKRLFESSVLGFTCLLRPSFEPDTSSRLQDYRAPLQRNFLRISTYFFNRQYSSSSKPDDRVPQVNRATHTALREMPEPRVNT